MSEHSGTGAKSADALEAIASVFRAHYEQRSFSGAGLVKRGDEVLFSGAYGYAHRGWRVPNTVSTRFDTASITKPFTAVAVLQLVERGLLSLHDGVLDILELQGTSISPRVSAAPPGTRMAAIRPPSLLATPAKTLKATSLKASVTSVSSSVTRRSGLSEP